ncbi:polysaccharide deacetylase family protein [Clostridium sp.]|uniref:polysaccharide deacetylase family protein n=1 Tax=Clostridium sp. TaxID=1506 RepID=UPI003F33684D
MNNKQDKNQYKMSKIRVLIVIIFIFTIDLLVFKIIDNVRIYNKEISVMSEVNNLNYELAEDIFSEDGSKIAYLTFDDGPNKNTTPQILKILNENNIKATFFVLGKNAEANPDILKNVYYEGHSIGNHTYSHDYEYVYKSSENLYNDILKTEEVCKNILGENYSNRLFRFPGGSSDVEDSLIKKVKGAGFISVDWNSLNGDAEKLNVSKETLIQNIKRHSEGKNKIVILMHDSINKKNTVDTLQDVIDYLREQGYEFKAIK